MTTSTTQDTLQYTGLTLPAEHRTLSPYTGFTREHWEAAADGMVANAWRWASPRGGRLDLPGRSSRSGVRSDGLEGYARTFLAAAFRVAGAGGADPHNWVDRYASGVVAGTENAGADDPESWPIIRDFDVFGQPMVESASVAIGLRLTRPWLWDQLNEIQQEKIEHWLRGSLRSLPAPNNWYLFPYTVAGFLESVGRGDAETARIRRRGLDLLESWYQGEGWYTDGDRGGIDYYVGWALHLYPVLDAVMSARESGAAPEQIAGIYGDRLSEHLETFSHFFAPNGAPIYMGRSMTYRFAAASAVGLGAAADVSPLTPGASRRIMSGTLRCFLDKGALNEHGLLSLGWFGEHEASLQPYSGPASPYWASKAFSALLAPADHPLWTATEEPMPTELEDHVVAVPSAGFLLQSTVADGVARMHNHGTDPLREESGEAAAAPDPLYARWSYSSHTGPTARHNLPDNDLAVVWRERRGSRVRARSLGAASHGDWGWAASWHKPIFGGGASSAVPGLRVDSIVVARGAYELRIHQVAGCPIGATVESTGWAVAGPQLEADLRSVLLPLAGWEQLDDVAAPTGTAHVASARVPRLRAATEPDSSQVFVALAALTHEDGAVSDPAQIIRGLRITEDSVLFGWTGDTQDTVVSLDPVAVTRSSGGAA
ncbi:DUF2264 domain-containing protein [Nesterenkonia sp. HG001]|uniref:DUF2264 domain-containing protein n=1 Tax=Nesterenkonia sp. HG001 TaxID=2983207 RepID=UPI002AC59559|nr:DUF2264 domain-containing protein [Nesterenkonia sp. HG001]MDZ5077022.1 DUF2264 domain-containing protein [Nesterenkonia sp. HG001]